MSPLRCYVEPDDAFFLRSLKSLCDLQRWLQRPFNRDGTAFEAIRQGILLNEFEYKEPGAFMFFKAVDRGNIGMVQRCEELGFAFKASQSVGVLREL